MAFAERGSIAGLRIDTIFARSQSPSPARNYRDNNVKERQTEEDSASSRQWQDGEQDVIDELHTETPPMAVPRPDDHQFAPDMSFSHKPEEAFSSPFDGFFREDKPRIRHVLRDKLDAGFRDVHDISPRGFESRSSSYNQLQSQISSLRKVQLQDDGDSGLEGLTTTQERNIQRPFPSGTGLSYISKRTDDQSPALDADRPTSLTSISTMSPLEEVRTPSEYPREGYPREGPMKDGLLSPLSSSPLVQRAASFDDPNLWSVGAGGSYGNKARSYNADGNNGWRRAMRQRSRRSTGSSAKSPASAFLSMWSSPEETVAPQPDDEGQMVGTDYVIGKQIGYGGFSTVKEAYKVEGDGNTRRLAVKIVRKIVSGKSERENDQVQAEFDHEVRIWRQLNYQHILSLEAVYETDYATFCFTKLAIGGTLFDLVKANRGGLDVNLAKKYSFELASAIRYLHQDMRVVHRDIKLENCLLDPVVAEDGSETAKLVLCDFGMAEWMTTDTGGEPLDSYDNPTDRPPPQNIGPSGSSTSVAGSLEYASPELLLSSSGMVDPVVDIWAFGVVVYATVVGSRPFQNSFGPRTRNNIIHGEWDQNAVLAGKADDAARHEILELICHCLDMDMYRRWTIGQVLNCTWFREYSQEFNEALHETAWRF